MSAGRSARPGPSLRFRRLRTLVLLVALITVVPLGAQLIRSGAAQSSADRPAPRAVAAVTPAPPPSAADVLERTVDGWEAESGGRLSLAVADLETGATARYGEQRHVFATASIVKVDILATLLLQRDGELSRAQKALAERMIEDSDNSAASALWRQIGRARGLAAANKRFGLTSTVGGSGGWWGRTTTTPADQLRLLHVIFTDESPLPAPSRAYVRALMGEVVPDQDWGVSAADTRRGSQYYVKNGWLSRANGWVLNSIGSVEFRGHPLLIVALSDGGNSMDKGVEALENVAEEAAEAIISG